MVQAGAPERLDDSPHRTADRIDNARPSAARHLIESLKVGVVREKSEAPDEDNHIEEGGPQSTEQSLDRLLAPTSTTSLRRPQSGEQERLLAKNSALRRRPPALHQRPTIASDQLADSEARWISGAWLELWMRLSPAA